MARHEVNRAAATYHAFVAILLLLLGGGLVGLGIWLRVSNSGGPVDLVYKGENFVNVVLGAAVIAIVIGAFFVLVSIFSLIALSRKCVGKVFRVVYIFFAIFILLALIVVATVCFVIVANRDAEFVRQFFGEAWNTTVTEKPLAICAIERQFDCRGFTDPKCIFEACAPCPSSLQSSTTGKQSCYQAFRNDLRRVYLPVAIVSTVIAIFVLIDLFVVCAL